MKNFRLTPLQSGLLGAIIGSLLMQNLLPLLNQQEWWPGHSEHSHTHENSDYHVHADFHLVVDDTVVDLATPEYMSTAEKILHADVHLHDDDGSVIHYHAPDISFVEFLDSLGITLTADCLTINEETICVDKERQLALYVNEEIWTDPIADYVPTDLDRILLYLGSGDEIKQREFMEQVEDRSCIFSGSCPERGIAPPESCGLTCEL